MDNDLALQKDRLELERSIERQIAERTWGRVHQLRVQVMSDRVLVQGYSSSYYVKQLALQGVLEAFRLTATPPVELNIEVGPGRRAGILEN